MIQNHSASEILTTGINMALMHGAPPDVVANLRGALAFVRQGAAVVEKDVEPTINELVPTAPADGVTNNE
jgi:hypothetical protein